MGEGCEVKLGDTRDESRGGTARLRARSDAAGDGRGDVEELGGGDGFGVR